MCNQIIYAILTYSYIPSVNIFLDTNFFFLDLIIDILLHCIHQTATLIIT